MEKDTLIRNERDEFKQLESCVEKILNALF